MIKLNTDLKLVVLLQLTQTEINKSVCQLLADAPLDGAWLVELKNVAMHDVVITEVSPYYRRDCPICAQWRMIRAKGIGINNFVFSICW